MGCANVNELTGSRLVKCGPTEAATVVFAPETRKVSVDRIRPYVVNLKVGKGSPVTCSPTDKVENEPFSVFVAVSTDNSGNAVVAYKAPENGKSSSSVVGNNKSLSSWDNGKTAASLPMEPPTAGCCARKVN